MNVHSLINKKLNINHKIAFPVLSLFALLLIIYGNSFNGEWHFDDFQNIVTNRNIQIKSLSLDEIVKTLSRPQSLIATEDLSKREIVRPVAQLSFALNYYFNGLEVYGYHLVNFFIHLLTSIILFFFIQRTLDLPLLKDKYGNMSYSIALLASILWASSPLNVNAVSYIVQRMTSLAGLFYLISMYLFLLARISKKSYQIYIFFVLSFTSAILSMGTKEIAIMIPFSIFIYDLLLINGCKNIKKYTAIFIISVLVISIFAVAYISTLSIKTLLDYNLWPFTLSERLLTEARVIIFYISLLVYPVNGRLMLDHDFSLSKSFSDPAVLASISAILIFIIAAFLMSKKNPLISFCIIFFFLNHIVEGTFIPLDLVFEHRNYVPSFFFFLPIVVFFTNSLEYFGSKNFLQLSLIALMTFIIAAQGHTVSMRNDTLLYDKLLWQDNIKKAPNLSRPHAVMGTIYFAEGKLEDAFNEASKSVELANYPNKYQFALYHVNLGAAYLIFRADEGKAYAAYKKALSIYPYVSPAYSGISELNLLQGNLDTALENIKKAIILDSRNPNAQVTLALVLLKKGDVKEAEKASRTALSQDVTDIRAYYIFAETMRISGNNYTAVQSYKRALMSKPNDIRVNLALIELFYELNDLNSVKKYIGRLIELKGTMNFSDLIDIELKQNKNAHAYIPNKKLLSKAIHQGLRVIN